MKPRLNWIVVAGMTIALALAAGYAARGEAAMSCIGIGFAVLESRRLWLNRQRGEIIDD
jgi:hypothetical protein